MAQSFEDDYNIALTNMQEKFHNSVKYHLEKISHKVKESPYEQGELLYKFLRELEYELRVGIFFENNKFGINDCAKMIDAVQSLCELDFKDMNAIPLFYLNHARIVVRLSDKFKEHILKILVY